MADTEPLQHDARFSKAGTDPRFSELSKKKKTVIVDKRFKKMFKDKSFKTTHKFDKFGRKQDTSQKTLSDDINSKYRLETSDSEENSKLDKKEAKAPRKKTSKKDKDKAKKLKKDSKKLKKSSKKAKKESQAPKLTNRLALVKQNWSVLRAVDILVLLSSGLSQGQSIISVSIFPSTYGQKKMKKESKKGPSKVWSKSQKLDPKKIRRYERKKLKYFFALVECDSIDTAKGVFDNTNHTQFENSTDLIQLQFIEDGQSFDHLNARDIATDIPLNYHAPVFEQSALSHSEIKLSWDLTDPKRTQLLRKNLEDEETPALKDYEDLLGSTDTEGNTGSEFIVSENELEEGEKCYLKKKKRAKYRAILDQIDAEMNKTVEGLDVTFTTGFGEEVETKIGSKEEISELNKKTAKLNVVCVEENSSAQPKKVEKEKKAKKVKKEKVGEKRKKKRTPKKMQNMGEKLEVVMSRNAEDQDMEKKGYNLIRDRTKRKKAEKKAQRKREKGSDVDDGFRVDVGDKRFTALMEDKNFSVDPSNPQFKHTEAMKNFIEDINILKKGSSTEPQAINKDSEVTKSKIKDSQLRSLMTSVISKLKENN